jgi:hypothetical protein
VNEPPRIHDDIAFLRQHTATVLLEGPEPGTVVVLPELQARTMTSATGHPSETSFGWINRARVAEGPLPGDPNLFGGEDRLWLGPEGGPFGLFFQPGAPQTLANWRIPSAIDVPRFELVEQTPVAVEMTHQDRVTNYAGFHFDVSLRRRVEWNDRARTAMLLGMEIDEDIWHVAHSSFNTVTHVGTEPWMPATGLIAVWNLGMYNPSEAATVVIPVRGAGQSGAAIPVTLDYFGIPDARRFRADAQRRLVFFRGDGLYRSKLGVGYSDAGKVLGAWDRTCNALTIVHYNRPDDPVPGYVNNLWKMDAEPWAGDAINAYNDGPNELGSTLGPFYELETLSPALLLRPGESATHVHTTVHLQGSTEALDDIATRLFGVNLAAIDQALG